MKLKKGLKAGECFEEAGRFFIVKEVQGDRYLSEEISKEEYIRKRNTEIEEAEKYPPELKKEKKQKKLKEHSEQEECAEEKAKTEKTFKREDCEEE